MIGSIDGLKLRNGFNPFAPGKLATSVLDPLNAVVNAKTKEEYQAARKAADELDQTRNELFALRPPFIAAAQAAGLTYTEAASVFDRLGEVVAEVQQLTLRLPTVHASYLDPELALRVNGLTDEWDRWCISSVMNQGKADGAMSLVFTAVNAADAIAAHILAAEGLEPPTPSDGQDREARERAALAQLLLIGPNAKRIAEMIHVPRTTLLGWPTFRTYYDKARADAQSRKLALSGRRSGASDFENGTADDE